jgi:hypothetical protein
MTTMAFILMNPSQRDSGEALNGDGIALGARAVNNPLADTLGHANLVGSWASPARLLDDPEYARWQPLLSPRPVYVLGSDMLFEQEAAVGV